MVILSPQTIQLADQAGDKNQLFRARFCLLCFCALKSLCNRLKKKTTSLLIHFGAMAAVAVRRSFTTQTG